MASKVKIHTGILPPAPEQKPPFPTYASIARRGILTAREKREPLTRAVSSLSPYSEQMRVIERLASSNEKGAEMLARAQEILADRSLSYERRCLELGALAILGVRDYGSLSSSSLVEVLEKYIFDYPVHSSDPKVPDAWMHFRLHIFAEIVLPGEVLSPYGILLVEHFVKSGRLAASFEEEHITQIERVLAALKTREGKELFSRAYSIADNMQEYVRLDLKCCREDPVEALSVRIAVLLAAFCDLRQENHPNCYAVAVLNMMLLEKPLEVMCAFFSLVGEGELYPGVPVSAYHPYFISNQDSLLQSDSHVGSAALTLAQGDKAYGSRIIWSFFSNFLQQSLLKKCEFLELNFGATIDEVRSARVDLCRALIESVRKTALALTPDQEHVLQRKLEGELFFVEASLENLRFDSNHGELVLGEVVCSFDAAGVEKCVLEKIKGYARFLFVKSEGRVVFKINELLNLLIRWAGDMGVNLEERVLHENLNCEMAAESKISSSEAVILTDLLIFPAVGGLESPLLRKAFGKAVMQNASKGSKAGQIVHFLSWHLCNAKAPRYLTGSICVGGASAQFGHAFLFDLSRVSTLLYQGFLKCYMIEPARRHACQRLTRERIERCGKYLSWSAAVLTEKIQRFCGQPMTSLFHQFCGDAKKLNTWVAEMKVSELRLAQLLQLHHISHAREIIERTVGKLSRYELPHYVAYVLRKEILTSGQESPSAEQLLFKLCLLHDLPQRVYLGDNNYTTHDSSREDPCHSLYCLVYNFALRTLTWARFHRRGVTLWMPEVSDFSLLSLA